LDAIFTWLNLSIPLQEGKTYCNKFGDYSGLIILGHYSDPDWKFIHPAVTTCEVAPTQQTTAACFIIAQRICGLPPSSPNAYLTITPMLTGHTVLDMDIDYNIGGTWNNMYDGPQSCPAIGLSLSSSVIFNAVLTTTVGISLCSLSVITAQLPIGHCEPRRRPGPRF
jgi:hypothetical protein